MINAPVVEEEEKVWQSCCLQLSRHCVAYTGQMVVIASIIGISAYFLVEADGDCSKSSPYHALLSFVLGKVLSTMVSSA